ncbi:MULTISPECIES: hypothetical protein [unclassified Leifsonia]|uniref:hypothetical protein n=1 Tax=unclassified Leifsonia TaxID=2663824 RepID=UPI0003A6CE92|nr:MULTISPECIES: hypothetical protein [unclassified Leifsonia]
MARLVSNPYYGAGLAVHRDLLVCQDCGYSGFAENDDAVTDDVAPPPREGALRRLLRFVTGR